MSELSQLRKELKALASPERAVGSAKTKVFGQDDYGAGDVFLGITVPNTRLIAKKFRDLPQEELVTLANSKYHEERLTALIILNHKYAKARDDSERIELFEFWLMLVKTYKVNNWDLIDASAPYMGEILTRHIGYDAPFLRALAKSENLWERRASIILTFPLIRIGKHGPTLAMAKEALTDDHHLIHKAAGWMLREVGKRDKDLLTDFLVKYKSKMPRTMLRYAIEKYPEKQRKVFLAKD
jgi:3-methyladenine DNA glycosylase AlkD